MNHISALFVKQSFQKILHLLKEIEIFMAIRLLRAMDSLFSFLLMTVARTLIGG